MSKIKIGLIGVGYFGVNYVRLLQNHNDAELVAICDTNTSAIEKLKLQFPNAEFVTDLEKIKLDGVIICTPVSTHYKLTKMALESGLNVLSEKPITETLSHAEELIFLAKERNLKLLSGHTFIYNSLVRYIKKLINDGALGEILYMTFQRTGKSPIRTDCNSLTDLSTHDISMALYWLGDVPKSVASFGKSYLQTGIEDVTFTTLEFKNNVVAHLHASWYEPIKQRKVTIIGTQNMLVFDDVSQTVTIYHAGGIEVPNVIYEEPLKTELNDFISSIKNNIQPMQNGEDGLNVVRVLEACQKSLKNNSEKVML